MKWTSIWGNAISIAENRPESYSKDITIRYPIFIPFDGEKVRITLDNFCGHEDVEISKATILYEGKFYPLYFSGNRNVVIKKEEDIVSDELELSVKKNTTLYVSFYLETFTEMRSAVFISGPLSGGMYALSDQTEVEDISIDISKKTNIVYFLSNVSLYSTDDKHAVICYGDSITSQDWPDYLKLLLKDEGRDDIAIIRKAASGTRILREYSCITYESYGMSGKHRFHHEIPVDGASMIIIQQGINDIIHPVGTDVNPFRPMSDLPTTEELIDGLKWYIKEARKMGLKVYGGTLLPIMGWRTYEDFREVLKNEYNDFIRETDLLDGFIDFSKALEDENEPRKFKSAYDSGDHLHPSKAGYEKMAEEVIRTHVL